MEYELRVTIGTEPIRLVRAEVSGAPEFARPTILSGKLLEEKAILLQFLNSNSNVVFKVWRYKFSRLESDGTFDLTKAW